MMDIESLRKENNRARQEINEFYKQNSLKNRTKEWIANNEFFSKLKNINIFALFWPNYDNEEYGNGDSILEYMLYCILNFFITASIIKLGFDYGVFPFVLLFTLVVQLYLNIKIMGWQAIVTNLIIYFLSVWLVTNKVNYAIINNTYHNDNIEKNDTISNNDFFIEQSKINVIYKHIKIN